MPHLTLQISANGPVVDVLVGVSKPRSDALAAAGQPVPAQVQIRALVDTGASCTCLDLQTLQALQLQPRGTATVHTPSTNATTPHTANQYDVQLTLLHPKLNMTFQALPVIEAQLSHQGHQALIGRDILANCLLHI